MEELSLQMRERVELAKRFLREAEIDLEWFEATRDRPELRRRSLFALQQACEKALKAYFYSALLDFLLYFRGLTKKEDRNLFPGAYKCLRDAAQYMKPSRMGHGLRGLLSYVERPREELYEGRLGDYLAYLIKERVVK